MAGKQDLTRRRIEQLLAHGGLEEGLGRLGPDHSPLPQFRPGRTVSAERARRHWRELGREEPDPRLLDEAKAARLADYGRNIENAIGLVELPVGVAGPLRINGVHARGDCFVPLATTEAALVASYTRGARLVSAAGGAAALCVYENLLRVPAFVFDSLALAARFAVWLERREGWLAEVAQATSSHLKLVDHGLTFEGNAVYLQLDFTTGEASGQNMVTIAGQAVLEAILAETPVRPRHAWVESNLSGDKKASAKALASQRGRKATAEVVIPAPLALEALHASVEELCAYWQHSTVGAMLAGTLGAQGHFANGLAALYLATGQDAACVAESALGVTRFTRLDDGSLHACVTLPGLMLGTVGGGTSLPAQAAGLELLGVGRGPGSAAALAEICAGLLLGGELSIIGAMAAGEFTRAHTKLGRGRK